jgi:type I restriction enzyme S subunit
MNTTFNISRPKRHVISARKKPRNHNLEETADEILIDAIHNQAIKKDALGSICCYVKDRVDCGILNNENYVSTDNMKPNKGGIELSSSVPDGKCISFILKDVLVSNIRPYFKKIWQATNKGGCSNDVLCFRSTNNTPSVLYHLLRSDSFFDYVMTGAKGSKMPRGDKSQIMKWEVPLFKPNYLYNLEKQLSVIDNSVSLNDLENKRLTVLRDTLLPSLLNGHINC